MTASVSWIDIAERLILALIAGGLIGYDRGTRGRIAGLRTTILMCLAATGAMIEANLTLSVLGKTSSSFTMMDALRFPLGILSGIGFIGAGAIVRRGRLVTGVTTAATLWLITVIGLIIGGGYLALGATVTAIAFVVLSLLKQIEPKMRREHRGNLLLRMTSDGPSDIGLRALIEAAGFRVTSTAASIGEDRTLRCALEWYSREPQNVPPPLLREIAEQPGVLHVGWEPVDAGQLEE